MAGNPAPAEGDDVFRLRAARDAALQAAQAAIRDTTRLTRLLTILSDPVPLELLLDRALSALSELFSADIVVLLDPAGTGTFSPLAAIGLPEDMIHQPMSGAEHSYVAAAMRTQAPVLTTQAGTDPKVDPQLRELGAETAVWLPVIGSQAARGALILARCRPVPFAHADADLLAAMAYRIGLALDQAQHSTQLEQIVRAGREIGHHLDESTVGTEAVRMLPKVVGADAAALVLNDPRAAAHCVAQFGLDPLWDFPWSRLAEYLLTDSFLANSQPYSTPDLRAVVERLSWELPNRCPVRALLAVPIRREEGTQGLLFAMRFSTMPFSPDTLRVAMLYAGQTSAALENARLYGVVRDELAERVRAEQELRKSEEQARHLARENATMAEIGRIISSSIEISEVYGRFAEEVRKVLSFDRISINIVNNEMGTATVLYVVGVPIPGRGQGESYRMKGFVTEKVVHTAEEISHSSEHENEFRDRSPSLLPAFQAGLRSLIFVPLMSKDQIIGVLHLFSLRPNAYAERDLKLAESIGNQIAGAIANAELFTERQRIGRTLASRGEDGGPGDPGGRCCA